ncbi:MAG: hypothetical protein ABJA67_14280 [Chthonomonadales bacterium]
MGPETVHLCNGAENMTLVELLAYIMALVMMFVCAITAWHRFHNVFAVLVGAVGGVFVGIIMVMVTIIVIGLFIFCWAKLTGQTELFEETIQDPESPGSTESLE